MSRLLFSALAISAVLLACLPAAANVDRVTEGRLDAMGPEGKALGPCPLKHTDVNVDIAGFVARVTVKQQFHNPFKDKIEAIYVFPLSQDAAVDKMTMIIGERQIDGEIKERGEAKQIYEQAKAEGRVASLLDQERPNIFTQSVANIEPGEKIDIEIAYSETLDWRDGEFHFDFPMVVGPRYMPGTPSGIGGGPARPGEPFSPPTDQVPDADRISPMPVAEGMRAGHDISVTVNLDAGSPIQRIESKQHEITTEYDKDKSVAALKLAPKKTIPNKDFVLVYQTATDEIEDAILTHVDDRGKFFTIVLQPPKRVRPEVIVPKEIIFVIDKSGSMSGFPMDTAKESMRLCINGLHENDTFNLMTFSGGVGFCFPEPVKNTDENRDKALAYLGNLQGSGGTEMMKAINACLAGQNDPERVRIVCFMTDGYVGNDMAIIDAVKKNAGTARVFSFGIGRSVNRYLLDGMARAGRGEVHYILSDAQADGAAERFYERVRMPVLTDVAVDFGKFEVEEVYPAMIPDLFSAKPVILKGRYQNGGEGTITLKGNTGEGSFEREINVTLPESVEEGKGNVALASMWARAKVKDLMDQQLDRAQRGDPNPAIKETILGLGLRYNLLTQYTSFVAVEKLRITQGDKVRTINVPVEMPEGVSHEGVFGADRQSGLALHRRALKTKAGFGGGGYFPGAAPSVTEAPKPQSQAQRLARQVDSLREETERIETSRDGRGGERAGRKEDAKKPAGEGESIARPDEGAGAGDDGDTAEAPQPDPNAHLAKLSDDLRKLLGEYKPEHATGTHTIAGLTVEGGEVEVQIQLSSLSEETLKKLAEAGFIKLAEAKTAKLVVGAIGVEKLGELCRLAEVLAVAPLKG